MRALRIPVFITILILAGCSGESGDVASPPSGLSMAQQTADADGFMPLSPGNHWTLDRTLTFQLFPNDGPPMPPETIEEQIDVDQVEYRSIGDHVYVVEHLVFSEGGGNELLRRQDRAGSYIFERSKDEGKRDNRPALTSRMRTTAQRLARTSGATVASIEAHFAKLERVHRVLRGLDGPMAGPPGGAVSGEIVTLAYPLHRFATWDIRPFPEFTATVEKREKMNGFSAWRVRTNSEFFDENDTVLTWHSRCGMVAQRLYLESIATDINGHVIGTIITDDIIDVVEIDIDRGGCELDQGPEPRARLGFDAR